jgi:hypothetical protein
MCGTGLCGRIRAAGPVTAAASVHHGRMSARELVFGVGDLVTGWGRVVSDDDGDWLDLARVVPLSLSRDDRPRSQRCSVRLVGVDVAGVPDAFGPGHVAPGLLTVTGIWRDMVIEVRSQTPTRLAPPPRPAWKQPPCPPPPGGWPRGARDENLTFDLADLLDSGAAVTVGTFRPGRDQAVLVVAASDIGAVRRVLGPQLPDRLCVVPSRFSREQLDDVRRYLARHRSGWGVEISSETMDDRAQFSFSVELLRVTADVADWVDSLPAGMLTLTPALRPADFS